MKIALIGYGRMGHEIEAIAVERGHEIVLTIDKDNVGDFTAENLQKADVAIEFTIPESGQENVLKCIDANVPVVSGTTGWNENMDAVIERCNTEGKTFFHASNFSLGVNLFFKINEVLAQMMNRYSEYDVSMEEIHHIHKQDAPSGTAITLAERILDKLDHKKGWELDKATSEDNIAIKAIREDMVPGTHSVTYDSEIDSIELTHTAKSRKGFALGAVVAAEFIKDKKGYLTMNDLLNL